MNSIALETQSKLPIIENTEANGSFTQTLEWLQDNISLLNETVLNKGAVLLRGFDIKNPKRFEKAMQILQGEFLNYVDGNSPRTKLATKVYTSTEFPAEFEISMHNEMSYSHTWPMRLFFCCQVAPKQDGNTLLADGRTVLQELDSDIVDAFRSKKVTYLRNLHGGNGVGPSWQDTFETDDKQVVENYCEANNIDFEWHEGELKLKQTVPAIISHPHTGEEVWFNQADQFHPSNFPTQIYQDIMALSHGELDAFPTYATFGDGEEIPEDMFKRIRQTFDLNKIYFDWNKGDMLILDNVLMAHGRAPFSGPRKILVAMCK